MSKEPNRVDAGVPTGGQFATTVHSDAVPVLTVLDPDPVLSGVAVAAVARRTAIQEQMWDLQQQIAVESAGALAARTRAHFPDAKYVTFRGNADTLERLEPNSIVSADGTTLASPDDWDTSGPYWRWAGDAEEDGYDVHFLAYDLEHHNGKLDGCFAPGTGVMNRYAYTTLDIDKALERTTP
jgi:hypothetical protein